VTRDRDDYDDTDKGLLPWLQTLCALIIAAASGYLFGLPDIGEASGIAALILYAMFAGWILLGGIVLEALFSRFENPALQIFMYTLTFVFAAAALVKFRAS
jgi:hypothetical protein